MHSHVRFSDAFLPCDFSATFSCDVRFWSAFLKVRSGNNKEGSITVPLTTCLTGFGSAVWQLKVFCFYMQCRLIQTSQTGGQWYSDTAPFSIPWFVFWHLQPLLACVFAMHFLRAFFGICSAFLQWFVTRHIEAPLGVQSQTLACNAFYGKKRAAKSHFEIGSVN